VVARTLRTGAGLAVVVVGIAAGFSAASAAAYSVTNPADAGPGTLRQAILAANAHPGADTVRFNLPGSGVRTIAITSTPLPTVSEQLVIDGRSQPGFAGSPLVQVDNASGKQWIGLNVVGAQSQVLGLEVTRFAVGVRLAADANRVAGNLIGTKTGDAGFGNATGVRVATGAGNRIGGIGPGAPNVVSSNSKNGIEIVGTATTDTEVMGNRIGTDPTGAVARPNPTGILLDAGTTANTIGGDTAAARNLISGNQSYGVRLAGTGTARNTISGNYVGTTAGGGAALANAVGIHLDTKASRNTIGGLTTGARNLISGNATSGVEVVNPGTTTNTVAGNSIGVDVDGSRKLANGTGVRIAGASGNTIGGAAAGARNLISGNTNYGVQIMNIGTTRNTIAGNLIGVDASGTAKLPNTYGVYVTSSASGNTIGGTGPGARNVISGNDRGVMLETDDNVVAGDYIGTDITGSTALGNGVGVWLQKANSNTIGGTTAGARNVISGNSDGVFLYRSAHFNTIAGNYIGTEALGASAVKNNCGVCLLAASDESRSVSDNTVGGIGTDTRNVISGNGTGVSIVAGQSGVGRNLVAGNYIGTDATAGSAIGNGSGVVVAATSGGTASANTIGGSTVGARNVISGSTGYAVAIEGRDYVTDVAFNTVSGNYIGTNGDGSAALPNGGGVHLLESSFFHDNTVGGGDAGTRNVISGNTGDGVVISGEFPSIGAGDDAVAGNYIGTKPRGGHALGNGGAGVRLETGAQGERIEANRIAFNGGPGVVVDGASPSGDLTSGDSILGNSIFANGGLGIDLLNGGNHDQAAPVITSVAANGGSTIIGGTLNSTPSTAFRIELFSSARCDPSGAGEGATFLGSIDVTTDGTGHATFSSSVPALPAGQAVTATSTSQATHDTSDFSTCFKSP
jgi:hypothetical protein